MITRVMGRTTATYWKVEPHASIVGEYGNGEFKYKFEAKPEIIKDVVELDPVEICQYEGRPCVSSYKLLFTDPKINIGDEEVNVKKDIFYADLSEWRQYVDKVVSNVDYGKESTEMDYANFLYQYNRQMIEADEKLQAYCDLHHLNPGETDVDELRKIVYANTTIPSYTISTENVVYTPITYTPTWGTTTTGTSITGATTTNTICNGWI